MYETKLTSKFQTTVPLDIRKFLEINKGEEIDWKIEGNRVVVGKYLRFENPLDVIKNIQIRSNESAVKLKKMALRDIEMAAVKKVSK